MRELRPQRRQCFFGGVHCVSHRFHFHFLLAGLFFLDGPLRRVGAVQQSMARDWARKTLFRGAAGPTPHKSLVDDPTICDPPCKEGRGVCNNNVCFCKEPYMGTTCQMQVDKERRMSYTLSTGIIITAAILGCVFGALAYQCIAKCTAPADTGEKQVRKETWKPSEAQPQKKGRR